MLKIYVKELKTKLYFFFQEVLLLSTFIVFYSQHLLVADVTEILIF